MLEFLPRRQTARAELESLLLTESINTIDNVGDVVCMRIPPRNHIRIIRRPPPNKVNQEGYFIDTFGIGYILAGRNIIPTAPHIVMPPDPCGNRRNRLIGIFWWGESLIGRDLNIEKDRA